jgi:hypothetical protein
MSAALRTAPAVLCAAMLGLTAAACSSSSSSSSPLAGMTADQIAVRAVADLAATSSVRVSGNVTSSGETIGLNLTLVRGQGCQGGMNLVGKGQFGIVGNATTVWIKPSDAFYKSVGASGTALSLLSGKWLKVPAGGSGFGGLSSLCDASSIAHSFAQNETGFTKGPATTIDGQPAIELTQPSKSTHVYVSDTASPQILHITGPKGQGYVDFGAYGAAATITPPAASDTLDGTKYGF